MGAGEGWPPGKRPCRKCKEMKPLTQFHKHANCALGTNSTCKACRRKYTTKYYRAQAPEQLMLRRARARAQKKYRAFDIDVTDVVIPEICPILGIPLDCVSLDRIDSSKGYVKGNVQVVSCRANAVKGSSTIEELEQVLAYMRRLLRG